MVFSHVRLERYYLKGSGLCRLSALPTYKIKMRSNEGNKQRIHLNGRITGGDYLDSGQSKMMGYN